MTKDKIDIQNKFINTIIKENIQVTVYTIKGVPIQCKIIGQDKFTLLLDVKGQQQLINKGGVSTIMPSKNVI